MSAAAQNEASNPITSIVPFTDELHGIRRAQLEQQLEDLYDQLDVPHRKLVDLMLPLSEEDSSKIRADLKVLHSEEGSDSIVAKYPENSVQKNVLIYSKELSTIHSEIENTKEKLKPFKIEELKEKLPSFLGTVNFDKLVEATLFEADLVGDDDFTSASHSLLNLRRVSHLIQNNKIEQLSYDDVDTYIYTIDSLEKIWAKRGFLYEIGDLSNLEIREEDIKEGEVKRKDILHKVQIAYKQLDEYAKLRHAFVGVYPSTFNEEITLSRIRRCLEATYAKDVYRLEDFEKYNFDLRFLTALEKSLDLNLIAWQERNVLPSSKEQQEQRYEVAKKLNAAEVAGRVEIIGFVAKPKEVLVIEESEFRDYLATNIPTVYLDKVKIIAAHEGKPTREEIKGDKTVIIETLGTHVSEIDDENNFVSSSITIYTPLTAPDIEYKAVIDYMKSEFLQTTVHEVAHSMHCQLTKEEMEKWFRIHNEHSVDVSSYVKRVRETSFDYPLNIMTEDFAESYMLFVTNPAYLYVLSIERYRYFMELVIRNMSENQLNKFLDLHEKLLSDNMDFAKFLLSNFRKNEK